MSAVTLPVDAECRLLTACSSYVVRLCSHAGAVWPRCRQQQGETQCNEPLLALTKSNKRMCIGRLCEKAVAVWCCPRPNHPDALCTRCTRDHQVKPFLSNSVLTCRNHEHVFIFFRKNCAAHQALEQQPISTMQWLDERWSAARGRSFTLFLVIF